MSTRSRIAILNDDKSTRSIYCHQDGYPEGVGKTLAEHYTTKERVNALLDLGDLSSLEPSIECPAGHSFDNKIEGYTVAYDRDRGEKNVSAITHSLMSSLLRDFRKSDQEYLYLFKPAENKWYIAYLDCGFEPLVF